MPGIFRQRKPRQFNYKPVFYDEKKEVWEERMKKYRTESKANPAVNYTPAIRKGSFKNYHKSTHKNIHAGSNIRLAIIIILLAIITYYLFLR